MIRSGNFISVYVQKDGVYTMTACDKSATLHIESEFLEITDPNSGTSRRRLPTITDWSISGDGLVDYNRMISALYMQQTLLARTKIQIKYFVQNGDGYAVYSGSGYFQSVDETGAVNAAISYSYSIVADGPLSIDSTIPQDSEEGQLLTVLMNSDNNLITNSNDNLIITG